jgi:hypothetical protein
MKEAAQKQHKPRIKQALYSIQDGWNFGVGFWAAAIALPFLFTFVILVFYFLFWAFMLLFG